MSKIDEIVEVISQVNAERKKEVCSTALDLTIANGQIALEKKTSKQGSFSLALRIFHLRMFGSLHK